MNLSEQELRPVNKLYTIAKRPVYRQAVVQPEDQSYRLIPLTQNQVTMVDTSDYERLRQWMWYATWNPETRSFYAAREEKPVNGKRRKVWMAREIMNATKEAQVDHRNHQTLDNRRSNLRLATPAENSANRRMRSTNTTGFTGVYRDRKRWRAGIMVAGKNIYLGGFRTPEEAHAVYQATAAMHQGEFFFDERNAPGPDPDLSAVDVRPQPGPA